MNDVKENMTNGVYEPNKANRTYELMRLMSLIGIMGLMSCSDSGGESAEEPTPKPTTTEVAITFSGHEEEEQAVSRGAYRRAGTPLSESATTFTVWGYKNMSESAGDYSGLQTVFPGYTVNWINGSAASTTTNSNGWEYVAQQTSGDEQTIKYWDWGAKAYRFFAVTGTYTANDANTEFTMTADCSGATDEAIATNMANAPFFSHLWFSTGNVGDYPDKQFGKPVILEFLKPFARVRFLFNYSYAAEGVKLTEVSFRPTNDSKIALKGSVTVSYSLTGTATRESYTTTPKAAPTAGEVLDAFTEEYIPEGTEKWYMVFPALSQGSYTMSVKVNNTTKTAVVPAKYMSWKPGYSYTYIFKITDEGGVDIDLVQSAVTPWTDMEIDNTVYNW